MSSEPLKHRSRHPFGNEFAVRISPRQARSLLLTTQPMPGMGYEYVLIDPKDSNHKVLLQNLCGELWLASHERQVQLWAGNFNIPLSQL